MKQKILFFCKQVVKMTFQNVLLPCIYAFWRIVYRNKPHDKIIFADAHHSEIPVSMDYIHRMLADKGYELTDCFYDFGRLSLWRVAQVSIGFMKLYAQAKVVFICDNFLPVSSCRKNPDTKVVQLLHSCGLFKKMGYDTTDDIPAGYIGKVYGNYDLVTVSAQACIAPLTKAMHLKDGVVKAIGVSRTDRYFSEQWRQNCIDRFYKRYPQAKGKKIILWAPTFRGNAANPYQVGIEPIDELESRLDADCYLIRKVHPHVDARYHYSNCDIPTEEILPVVDLLISDYSSVTNEFMAFGKPYVLFAPDLTVYEKQRGFYVEYDKLTPYVAKTGEQLYSCVLRALSDSEPKWVEDRRKYHLGACDGHSTQRILDCLGL